MLIERRHFEWNLREKRERAEAADQAEADGKHDIAALLRAHQGGIPFIECGTGTIPELCFYCAERLTIPCVYWHGAYGEGLWVHRECAKELADNLLTDSQRTCHETEGGDSPK